MGRYKEFSSRLRTKQLRFVSIAILNGSFYASEMDTSARRDPEKSSGYMRFVGLGKLAFFATIGIALLIEKWFGINLDDKTYKITVVALMIAGMVGCFTWAVIGAVRFSRESRKNSGRRL